MYVQYSTLQLLSQNKSRAFERSQLLDDLAQVAWPGIDLALGCGMTF